MICRIVVSFLFSSLVFLETSSTLVADDIMNVKDSTQFFVEPNILNDFVFFGGPDKPIPYRFLNEKEVVLSDGMTRFENGKHIIRLLVPSGYNIIDFPEKSQRFGIVSLPAFSKDQKDPFFCIDGAFSWLVPDDQRREDYTKIADRIGLSVIRERLSWSAINKKEGEFNWEGDRRYDRMRQTMKANNIGVLEVWHDTPGWVGYCGLGGKSGKLPGDLIKTANAWKKITEHWQPTWAALELWNEPDISFSGDLPGDQYAPMVNAIAYRLKTDGIHVPLIGASLATFNRVWLETAINSGMLDGIDGFSFHTYAKTPSVENLYLGLSEMVHTERPDLTFWLTECGRPWKRGVGRPPRDQDIISACDIIMKGVEAKASVVDYYYPFVYPYYDENDNNFAMMDKWGSPLRSMGAYVQMIRLLSGFEYIDSDCKGMIQVLDGPDLIRIRAFKKQGETVLVLYTGDTAKATTIRQKSESMKFLEAESLTGESIPVAKDGTLIFQNGLVYLRVRSDQLQSPDKNSSTLIGQRQIWRKEQIKKNQGKSGAVVSPIVAVYRFDPSAVVAGRNGYHINKISNEKFPLLIRIYNLDNKANRVSFRPISNSGKLSLKEGEKTSLEIPAGGFVEQTILVDFADELAKNFQSKIRFEYVLGDVKKTVTKQSSCRLQLVFSGEPEWQKIIAIHSDAYRLPIEKKELWRSNVGAQGKLEMNFSQESNSLLDDLKPSWSFNVKFGQGDRWVYPVFSIPKEIDFSQYKGMILRARCSKGNTQPRLMLYETKQGSGYMTTGTAFVADGEWHTAVIPFSSLEHVGATQPDPNGRLDLDLVRTLSIGGNTKETEIQIDVSDCLLYK